MTMHTDLNCYISSFRSFQTFRINLAGSLQFLRYSRTLSLKYQLPKLLCSSILQILELLIDLLFTWILAT